MKDKVKKNQLVECYQESSSGNKETDMHSLHTALAAKYCLNLVHASVLSANSLYQILLLTPFSANDQS